MSNEVKMVEIVARAIKIKMGEKPFDMMCTEYAKAAIVAMREPTEEMTVHGLRALCDKIEELDPECETAELVRNGVEVNATWKAMIDAALKE